MNFLIMLLVFCSVSLYSFETEEDRSFYAISSLKFYLDNLLEYDNEEDKINFEKSDIEFLWKLAKTNQFFFPELDNAQKNYIESLENESIDTNGPFLSAKSQINYIWHAINEKIVNKKEERKNVEFFLSKSPTTLQEKIRKNYGRYLLSERHPIKSILDAIFFPKVTQNKKKFLNAGFNILFEQPYSHIVVSEHPQMPGYIQKLYLDTETRMKHGKPGWKWLIQRCMGAENVRNLIAARGLKFFTVPDKWIYLLPNATKGSHPAILVATKMNLVSQSKNVEAWRNISHSQLDELYIILSHGYSSSYVVNNIPYTKEGLFCCVDTEHVKRKISYRSVKKFIGKDKHAYWDRLVKTGGNP